MQKRLNWHDPIAAKIREAARTSETVYAEFDGAVHELVEHSNGRTPAGFHVDTTWQPVDGDLSELRPAEVAEQPATQEAATDDNTDETPDDAAGLGQGWPETVAGDQRPYEV